MEQKKGETPSPFSAWYDEGSYKKTADALRAKLARLTDRIEVSHKNPGSQTSISEKQMTADEKFLEEGVWDKLPSKSVSSSPHKSSASPSSFKRSHDSDRRRKSRKHHDPLLSPSPPRRRKKHIISAQSVRKPAGLQYEPSFESPDLSKKQLLNISPVCGSNTKGEVWEEKEKMEQKKGETPSPFSDEGRYKKMVDALRAKLEKLNDRIEVSHKNAGSQTSISGKQMTADEKSSEEGVWDKLPSKSVSSSPHKSSASSSFKRSHDSERRRKSRKHHDPLLSLSSPRRRKKHIISAQSESPDLSKKQLLNISPVYSSYTKGEVWEEKEKMEQKKGETPSPFSAGYDKGSYKKRVDALRAKLEKLTDRIEVLSKNPGPPCPQGRSTVLQAGSIAGSRVQEAFEPLSVQSDSSDVLFPAVNSSDTNALPAHSHLQTSGPGSSTRGSSCLPRSHSSPSLSQTPSAKNKTFTRARSLPDMLLKSSFEEFTPEITADENDETFRFQCSCPGLYQCSKTGLVFHMEGEGDVVYRIVPWNRRLLAQHHKQPAGPLFDIKCLQQSVCQLRLPHCEIRSTGGSDFLSVAHVNDEGVEFISPHKITETHVVINITGCSGFGNVKDEDSPPDPVRALVLLFYRPPADPDLTSVLNVLLLPRNVVLRDVLRIRKKLDGDERYIETSPHCKLHPKQDYTLSTCPEDDSVLVQPTEAEFDSDNYDNYFPSFQVNLETVKKHIKLFLRDANSSHSVWERRVYLSSAGVNRSCGPSALNLPPNKRLLDVRSSFIEGISGPVLQSLLDKLLERKVMTESERESAEEMQKKRDKARFVIDAVRKKGEAASSEMIEFLCEADPFLCEHLGLM